MVLLLLVLSCTTVTCQMTLLRRRFANAECKNFTRSRLFHSSYTEDRCLLCLAQFVLSALHRCIGMLHFFFCLAVIHRYKSRGLGLVGSDSGISPVFPFTASPLCNSWEIFLVHVGAFPPICRSRYLMNVCIQVCLYRALCRRTGVPRSFRMSPIE